MSNYKCERCLKEFDIKLIYDRHITKKKPCTDADNNKKDEIAQRPSNFKCNNCSKTFIRKDTLKRHINQNICKIENEQNNQEVNEIQNDNKEPNVCFILNEDDFRKKKTIELEIEMERKQKEMDMDFVRKRKELEFELLKKEKEMELEQKMGPIKKKVGRPKKVKIVDNSNTINNIQNIQQNNQQNNINVNVKLVAHGKEDLSFLEPAMCKKILDRGAKALIHLIESIYFNVNKPENQNIYISNMRDGYLSCYDGNEWIVKERDPVLQDLFDIKVGFLETKFDELQAELGESIIRKFQRFLDVKDDDKIMVGLKKDLRFLLYNKRKMVENNKEIMANNQLIKKESGENK